MFYVYVLLSLRDNNFYIGFTRNISQRLKDHTAGRNESTKLRRPVGLVYYEAHLNREDALRREKYFKTSKGKSSLKQILRTTISTQNQT